MKLIQKMIIALSCFPVQPIQYSCAQTLSPSQMASELARQMASGTESMPGVDPVLAEGNMVVARWHTPSNVPASDTRPFELASSSCTHEVVADGPVQIRYEELDAKGNGFYALAGQYTCYKLGRLRTKGVVPSFLGGAIINYGERRLHAHVLNCDDWIEKLGTVATNESWAILQNPKSASEKSEYETSEEYRKRVEVESARAETIWANLIIEVNPNAITYDAERKEARLAYTSDAGPILSKVNPTSSYMGQTMFGVKAKVQRVWALSAEAKFTDARVVFPANVVISMSPDQARNLKEHGLIHILGRVLTNEETSSVGRATLDSPTDFFSVEHTLTVSPACVAVSAPAMLLPNWQWP